MKLSDHFNVENNCHTYTCPQENNCCTEATGEKLQNKPINLVQEAKNRIYEKEKAIALDKIEYLLERKVEVKNTISDLNREISFIEKEISLFQKRLDDIR